MLHLHVIVRISRHEAPSPEALKEAARSATATAKIDGVVTEWGAQAKCDSFRADGDGAKTIWYLSKALNYVLKDVVLDAGEDSPEACVTWRDSTKRRGRCVASRTVRGSIAAQKCINDSGRGRMW